jgi:hypothetical protein
VAYTVDAALAERRVALVEDGVSYDLVLDGGEAAKGATEREDG